MGEKGNAASAAEVVTAAGAPPDSSFLGAAAGSAVAGGASVAVDVAETTKDNLVDIVADHAIDEGRDRWNKRHEDDNASSEEASSSDTENGVGDQAPE